MGTTLTRVAWQNLVWLSIMQSDFNIIIGTALFTCLTNGLLCTPTTNILNSGLTPPCCTRQCFQAEGVLVFQPLCKCIYCRFPLIGDWHNFKTRGHNCLLQQTEKVQFKPAFVVIFLYHLTIYKKRQRVCKQLRNNSLGRSIQVESASDNSSNGNLSDVVSNE